MRVGNCVRNTLITYLIFLFFFQIKECNTFIYGLLFFFLFLNQEENLFLIKARQGNTEV